MDESVRLLTYQQQLESEADHKVKFFGLSINETIKTCILNGLSKRADKIKSDFKVSDKRWATIPTLRITFSFSSSTFSPKVLVSEALCPH